MTFIAGLFLAIIAFAVAATLVIFAIGPIMVLNPRRRGEGFYKERGDPLSPADLQIPFEEFWFVNTDMQRLHAWFIPAKGSARGTIFYLHGVGDNKISGLRLAQVFHLHHFNVMMYRFAGSWKKRREVLHLRLLRKIRRVEGDRRLGGTGENRTGEDRTLRNFYGSGNRSSGGGR